MGIHLLFSIYITNPISNYSSRFPIWILSIQVQDTKCLSYPHCSLSRLKSQAEKDEQPITDDFYSSQAEKDEQHVAERWKGTTILRNDRSEGTLERNTGTEERCWSLIIKEEEKGRCYQITSSTYKQNHGTPIISVAKLATR